MTQPRRIRAGTTYLVTRRTVRRHCLFAPDPRITQVFSFVLAWCAQHVGVDLHAVVLMSTHEHIVLTDVHGVLPRFLQLHHRLVALATKVLRSWEGAVWDHRESSLVELVTPEAIIEKIAYVIVNPVAAGLVAQACEWPGVITLVEQLAGGTLSAARPTFYFSSSNRAWGESASVTLTLPPMLEGLYTPESFRAAVAAEVERQMRDARAERASRGRSVLGRKKLARASPFRRAAAPEPLRERNPTIAAARGQVEKRVAAICELRAFRAAYREALARWRAGDRSVAFPEGTWGLRLVHAARVAPTSRRAA